MNTQHVNRTFYANPLMGNMFIILAALSLPLQFMRGGPSLGGFNIVLFVCVAIMLKKVPLVVAYDDYMTYRVAPIRGQNYLRYADINELDVKGKKLFVTATGEKPLKINLSSFSSTDGAALIRMLETKQVGVEEKKSAVL